MGELLGGVAALLALIVFALARRTERSTVKRLARGLPGFRAVEGTPCAVEGEREGRRMRVLVDLGGRGRQSSMRGLVYQVEARGAAPLALERAADARAWARAGAHGEEARAAIDHLFGLGIDGLVIRDGWLTVRRIPSTYALAPERVSKVLSALERLAPLFERRSLTIRVGGAEREGLAWSVGEQVLCPYCRDDLKGDDLAACEACGTVHHAECLTEGGGCSVFACAGREPGGPERVRSPSG